MFDSQCDDDLYMRHDPDIRWCVNMRRRMVVWLKKGKSCIVTYPCMSVQMSVYSNSVRFLLTKNPGLTTSNNFNFLVTVVNEISIRDLISSLVNVPPANE